MVARAVFQNLDFLSYFPSEARALEQGACDTEYRDSLWYSDESPCCHFLYPRERPDSLGAFWLGVKVGPRFGLIPSRMCEIEKQVREIDWEILNNILGTLGLPRVMGIDAEDWLESLGDADRVIPLHDGLTTWLFEDINGFALDAIHHPDLGLVVFSLRDLTGVEPPG